MISFWYTNGESFGLMFYSSFSSFNCDLIKGIFGAKKYPVRLANKIGIKYVNPVNVATRIVVLIGVRVTVELIAAIQQIIAKEALMSGNNSLMIRPNVAPTKNKGIIKPPRQPEVTVIEMAVILKNKIANNMDRVKGVFKSSFTSW